jgi:hypothetical protein
MRRPGFALLAVLWIIVGLTALAVAMSLVGREAIGAAQNRLDLARARWTADGCLARVRAVIAETLTDRAADANWAALDRVLRAAPVVAQAGCRVTARPDGAAVDVNAADADALRRLFLTAGLNERSADSLAAVVVARARRSPIGNVRELALGPVLDTLFTTDSVRICLSHASAPVLASLPGMTLDALAHLEEYRRRGVSAPDLRVLASELPAAARDTLMAHYAEIAERTTTVPDGWIVTAAAGQHVPVSIEVRFARAAAHGAIMWRRELP